MSEREPPRGVVLNLNQVVATDYEGRSISGTFVVWAGMITVSSVRGSKTTQVGGAGSKRAVEWLAKIMLRDLAQEGKA